MNSYAKFMSFGGFNTPSNCSSTNTPSREGRIKSNFSNRMNCEDDIRFDPAWLSYNIRRIGSHIYFYEEINEVTQMILAVYIKAATAEVLSDHVAEIISGELPDSVTIHLNSPGGYLSSGFALYDYIKTSQIPITCVVEGVCASAATLIMLACHVRIMSPNSTFLMHQCSWGCWGENRYMQDHAENAEKAMSKLRKIYFNETKIADGKSDKERLAYIQHMLEHDFELSTEECVELGILPEHDDEEDDVELSEERVEKLQNFIKKLAKEQRKENNQKLKEALEEETKKEQKPSKKNPEPKAPKEPGSPKEPKTPSKKKTSKPKAKPSKKEEEPAKSGTISDN